MERSDIFLEAHTDGASFVHRRSEPKYFVLHLSESHRHYAAGFRFAVQLLNEDSQGEAVLYFKESCADYNSGSLRVPSEVFAAALRQKPGSGDYVDESGQSRAPV